MAIKLIDELREQWRQRKKVQKVREQARIRQQRYRDKRQAARQFEVRGIVTDCEAKAARIKVAAAEINAYVEDL